MLVLFDLWTMNHQRTFIIRRLELQDGIVQLAARSIKRLTVLDRNRSIVRFVQLAHRVKRNIEDEKRCSVNMQVAKEMTQKSQIHA